jgi:flagellar motor switch protein FliM
MTKVLDQEQINALIRVARQGSSVTESGGPVVQPWDIHQARKIGREQLNSINQLHEVFARNLGRSLAAYLRTTFECTLVSAEHLTFSEFLGGVPAVTYLASCDLMPVGVIALLQVDLAIAFSIIDLLLGGEGSGTPPGREVTEIEEQIIDSIMRIICRELQSSWQAVSLEFNFRQRQPVSQAHRLMPPEEKSLCLSFEVKIADARGTLNLAVPAVASNALLRKISLDDSYKRAPSAAKAPSQVQEKLQRCPFAVELVVPGLRIPARLLADLAPGTILPFSLSVTSPAALMVEEVPLCSAAPVRVNSRRAARVLCREGSAL